MVADGLVTVRTMRKFSYKLKSMAEKKEFLKGKKAITFLDLFAGAGGISEGFLQAYTKDKYYKFVLASDINENCELTHKVRYNHQLGLDTKFLTCDIMASDFVEKLIEQLQGQEIDVITGGPSCQSFSLSGRRKRFDKRDNLFLHYLNVIRQLRPKYFVMENVKGLLTKDKGHFKDAIMREIRSIIDDKSIPQFLLYLDKLLSISASSFVKNCILTKVQIEIGDESSAEIARANYFIYLESQFKAITKKIEYRLSKSNIHISTIRHGLNLLRQTEERSVISSTVINLKSITDIDNDYYVNGFNSFLSLIDDSTIINTILSALDTFDGFDNDSKEVKVFRDMVRLYSFTLDETLDTIKEFAKENGSTDELDNLLEELILYRIAKPIVVHSADYGVPQNRERVIFIGCRKDQELIDEIPATVTEEEKVTVYEALHDLDFISNGSVETTYGERRIIDEYESLIRHREAQGHISNDDGTHTFAEWSKIGRLSHRFTFDIDPFYVRNIDDLESNLFCMEPELYNHQTSSQNEDVKQRLRVIAEHGVYDADCKAELSKLGLDSNKRNYTVLNPAGQSPTVVTMPDDFIHYSAYRAMTVREMARLQSFDDSFVFQGKRQTGGNKRKSEIPQFTLVGNAVPPLMARAIANTILKHIK